MTTRSSSSLTATTSATSATNATDTTDNNGNDSIAVGRLVEVASRTWPGINKPGGVARVTELHYHPEEPGKLMYVDVAYIVGRSKERKVPLDYVTLAPQFETKAIQPQEDNQAATGSRYCRRGRQVGLRDRSLLLGRCRRCGSLRTDCGSCDWAFEEDKQVETVETSKHKARKEPVAQEDLSSSSSDDDDVALQQLLQDSNKKYRRHLRHKRRWNSLYGGSENTEDDSSSKIKSEDKLNKDDEEDEDDLEELLKESQQRYRRHTKQRSKWQRRIQMARPPSAEDRQRRRRKMLTQRSVLETLDPKPSKDSSTTTDNSQKTLRGVVTVDQGTPAAIQKENDIQPSENTATGTHIRHRKENNTKNVDESPIGIAETSSPEVSVEQNSGSLVFADDDHTEEQQPMDAGFQRRVSVYLDDPIDWDKQEDLDKAFIQPEGREHAESLPSDTMDRTKSIPFAELPKFFEETIQDLEDFGIPDFNIKIAQFKREHRRLVSPLRLSQAKPNIGILLKQCDATFAAIRDELIRNGTDQCQIALRKMSDDRMFRKHRKQLSSQQRKQIRSATLMDARNLRLDAIEESVQELVRNLKNVTEGLEALQTEQEVDAGDDDISTATSGSDDEAMETQDLLPIGYAHDEGSTTLDPSERPLGAFNPHQHATKVRKRQRDTADDSTTRQTRRPARKESNQANGTSSRDSPLSDFIIHDEQPWKKQKQRAMASNQRNQRFPRGKDYNKQRKSNGSQVILEEEEEISVERDKESDQDIGQVHCDFLDAEVNEDEGTSSPTLTSREPNEMPQRTSTTKRGRRKSQASSDISNEPSNRVERISISKRMQDFLDKNKEFDSFGQDEGEEDSIAPGTDASPQNNYHDDRHSSRNRCRQQLIQISGRHSYGQATSTATRYELVLPPRSRGSTSQRESCSFISRDFLIQESEPNIPLNRQARSPQSGLTRSATMEVQSSKRIDNDERHDLSQETITNNAVISRGNSPGLRKEDVSKTLLELIASRDTDFETHVQRLASLVERDETLGGEGNRENFLLLLILQFVDAVFALLHPTGWSLDIPDRSKVLHLLTPIRDALARKIPITEAICRCITDHLSCQQWRVSGGGDYIFVSSMAPDIWKNFVESGDVCSFGSDLRYQKLGKVWPRTEVDVTWNVLLFCCAKGSNEGASTQARWQLISKLFSSSTLAKPSEKEVNLPPHPLQLATLETDISLLVRLLRWGALDPLPSDDKLFATLVRKCVTLQVEDYLGNEESRFRDFPSLGSEKNAARLVARIWKETTNLLFVDGSNVEHSYIRIDSVDFCRTNVANRKCTRSDFLRPNSTLLGHCLSLLVGWASRLPAKKVRRARFWKQIKSLRDTFKGEQRQVGNDHSSEDPSSTSDPFGNSFESKRPVEIGNARYRATNFLCETSVYMGILEILHKAETTVQGVETSVQSAVFSSQKLDEEWEVAAPELLRVYCNRSDEQLSGPMDFSIDPLRVFLAGKAMAMFASLSLGISPWESMPNKRFSFSTERNFSESGDCFISAISRLILCVDFLSRQGESTALLSRLLVSVTALMNQATLVAQQGENAPFLDRLAVQSSWFLWILMQSLQCISTSLIGSDDLSTIPSCLCAICAVSTFQASLSKCRGQLHLGGISDRIGQSHEGADSWKILVQILWALKPSEMYKIGTAVSRPGTLRFNTQAKFILRKENVKILDCLLALALKDGSCAAWDELCRLARTSSCDPQDCEYFEGISKHLTHQITVLSHKFSTCRSFVSDNMDAFICGAIREMLNSNRLEAFPSCNLDMIKDVEGETAGREAIVALDLFNGDARARPVGMSIVEFQSLAKNHQRLRSKAEKPWAMVRHLIDATLALTTLQPTLTDIDNDLLNQYKETVIVDCLEREIFRCFRFLRTTVSRVSKENISVVLYERVTAQIIELLASECLRIAQALKYIDRVAPFGSQESDVSDGRLKVSILFHAFTELFIASTAWILREFRFESSDRFKALMRRLNELIFYPMLRWQPFDFPVNLKSLVDECRDVLGLTPSSISLTSIQGCARHFEHSLDAGFRRCRQLLVFAPLNSCVLQNQMIEGMQSVGGPQGAQIAKLIGRIFTAAETTNTLIAAAGPLQEEIDRYLNHVESILVSNELQAEMQRKKIDMLKAVIIPKLAQRMNNVMVGKALLLQVAACLLEATCDALASESETIESLLRQIRVVVFQSMGAPSVCEKLVAVAFQCVANIAKLKLADSGSSAETFYYQNCLDFNEIDPADVQMLCRSELRSLYVHCFFEWMYALGKKIENFSWKISGDGFLPDFRTFCSSSWRPSMGSVIPNSAWDRVVEIDREVDLEERSKLLLCIEDQLVSGKQEKSRPVNIYAKETATASAEQRGVEVAHTLQAWNPASSVHRSAKEYLATILSMSS